MFWHARYWQLSFSARIHVKCQLSKVWPTVNCQKQRHFAEFRGSGARGRLDTAGLQGFGDETLRGTRPLVRSDSEQVPRSETSLPNRNGRRSVLHRSERHFLHEERFHVDSHLAESIARRCRLSLIQFVPFFSIKINKFRLICGFLFYSWQFSRSPIVQKTSFFNFLPTKAHSPNVEKLQFTSR